MQKRQWLWAPLGLVLLAGCEDGNGGGGSGGGANCSVAIPLAVTGELQPQYSWTGDDVSKLSVARVENLEFLSDPANATSCATAEASSRDERCKIAYSLSSLPSSTGEPREQVASPVLHAQTGSFPDTVHLTEETPLEMGRLYQVDILIADGAGTATACGCLRFTAGTAASGDGDCGGED